MRGEPYADKTPRMALITPSTSFKNCPVEVGHSVVIYHIIQGKRLPMLYMCGLFLIMLMCFKAVRPS